MKYKNIVYSLIILFMFCFVFTSTKSAHAATEGDYTLYNFEEGTKYNWKINGDDSSLTSVTEVVGSVVFQGQYALEVDVKGGKADGRYTITIPKTDVKLGQTYTFNYYIPAEFDVGAIQPCAWYKKNGANTLERGTTINPKKGSWQKFTFYVDPLKISEPSIYEIILIIQLNKNAENKYSPTKVYFDSVHDGSPIITPTPIPTSVPTQAPILENRASYITVNVGEGGTVDLKIDETYSSHVLGKMGPYPSEKVATLTANPQEGYTFSYWENQHGLTVTSSINYVNYIGSGIHVKAVFKKNPTEEVKEYTVIFQDRSGRILKTDVVPEGGTAVAPPDPAFIGYSFVRWDKDFSNVTTDLIVYAIYKREETTYSLTVVDGKLSTGETSAHFQFDKAISVVADEAAAGYKFSHWELDGIKVCDSSSYSFFMPKKDATVTAVFVEDTVTVEYTPFITMTNILVDSTNKTITFVATRNVPVNFTLIESGIILFQSDTTPDTLDLDTPDIIKGIISNHLANQFYMRKNNVITGHTWYARGYLIYQDLEGNQFTVYSGIVSQSMS